MDSVSHLLRLARVDASLDKRCLLAPATQMDVEYGQRVAPFHVLLEGECDLQVGTQTLHLRPGDVVVIPSGARHRVTTGGASGMQGIVETAGGSFATIRSESGAGGVDLFCGHFTFGSGAGAMLFRSLPDPVRVSFGQSPEADEVIRTLSSLMRAEAKREGAGTAAIMSALCSVLLAMVLRTSSGDAGQRLWTAAGDGRIAALIEEVVSDPGADWSIERMSGVVRMSRATFIRRFSQSTGSTVGAFLARTRLMTAAEMLRTGDQNIAAVAAGVGYRSESAFSRAFREATGMTPAKFRRNAHE
jgi:AraC family transcriptional activator of mtrCDE